MPSEVWAIILGALTVIGGILVVLLAMLNNTYQRIEIAIALGQKHETRIEFLERTVQSIHDNVERKVAELDMKLASTSKYLTEIEKQLIRIESACKFIHPAEREE